MTSLGDLCLCGDLARPGFDLCGPCLEDVRVARAELAAEIAQITAEQEAKTIAQDEVTTYQETT